MQTGLIALDVVAKLNRVDVDLKSASREHGISEEEVSAAQLLRIARQLQFKAKPKRYKIQQLPERYPLPAIYRRTQDGGYGVLLKRDKEKQAALVFVPGGKDVQEIPYKDFHQTASNDFIILRHKKSTSQSLFGFRWFYQEILKYRGALAEVMLASFMVQLFGLITPLFTQVILDKVIVHRTLTTLDVLAVAFLFTMVWEFLFNITRNYTFIQIANKVDAILGAKLFRHLFSLPFVYFESRRVGTTVARVKELDNIREFVTSKSVSVIIDLLFSFVFLAMMFLYSVPLSLMVLAFVAIVSVLYIVVTPELRNRLQAKFLMAAQSQSYLVEAITGIQTVKSLAIEGTMQRKWEDALGQYIRASFNLSTIGTIAGAISNVLQRAMTIAVLYFGVKLVIENKMSVGMLIAFQMYCNQFSNPVLRLVNLWNEFQQALLGVDRLGDILDSPAELHSAKAITLANVSGNIKFDNVSFRYAPDSPYALNGVSFEIPAGSSLGIVGRSGSGKSTIAKVVQRLYVANEGAVFVDGIDARHLNPFWLRQNIGMVLQDNFLFSGTIRDNIGMAKPNADMEEVVRAAQIAGAHDFISEFPQGYDTEVGERGSTLSGGQRQRIAIARALITNPKILIFDEATSALDYESERIIQQNLEKIKQGRTLIIIAHRLSAVAGCNSLLVMDKGKVVQHGSHRELLSQPGTYQHLYRQQEVLNAASV
ncbi:MAG TPA: type I secretion system permease/ATPase [Candidatus Obscuribacterales bacterium]